MLRPDLTDEALARLLFEEMQARCLEMDPDTKLVEWNTDHPNKEEADCVRDFLTRGASVIRRELDMFVPTHVHVKTGIMYQVLHEATDCTNRHKDPILVVVYRNASGRVFVREASEFLDGRFQIISGR